MIPLRIYEILFDKYDQSYEGDLRIDAAKYGYSLAMEEMKPILDAARELVKQKEPPRASMGHYQALRNISQLLKQFDDDTTK